MDRWFLPVPTPLLPVAHFLAAIEPARWSEQKPMRFMSPSLCGLSVTGRLVDKPVNRCVLCRRAMGGAR
jgi:hypothetical protein